jgi:uncharacterized protein (DUF608 family)
MPLGGIGGGNVQINGKAQLQPWQIFNNHDPLVLPHTFFAVRVAPERGRRVVRALQTEPVGPFAAMDSLEFRGEHPFGWFDFKDPSVPVDIRLEAFSPLMPMNAKDSAVPCALFNMTVENTSDKPVNVSFLASQQNAVGYRTPDNRIAWGPANLPCIDGRSFLAYGGNRNQIVREQQMTALNMTADSPRNAEGGDMTLAVAGEDVTGAASWTNLGDLCRDFAEDGRISGPQKAGPTPKGKTIDGALACAITVAPGDTKTVTFLLTWYFPNGHTATTPSAGDRRQNWIRIGRMYCNWWSDSLGVARYVRANFNRLESQTWAYHDAFYETNLPYWLLDRISSQAACLKSQTCFWDKDGYFGGWEGCLSTKGCCKGNCTHVWHYAQTHARLFPSIGRRMREQSFFYQSQAGGFQMRHTMPKIAFDGQCGEILGAYREHLCSVDARWLDKHWPNIRKAMGYVIDRWDSDEDGIPSGPQHNTLDAELSGSTSWLGTLYLAALAASEKMATLQGDAEQAQRYREIRLAGAKLQDSTLFNGEYYVQIPDEMKGENYLTGCHVDQLLGQWWAHQLNLGWLYERDRTRTALQSIMKYNFHTDFTNVRTFTTGAPWRGFPRKYVRDDDRGLIMTTWPKGGRPEQGKQLRFADEVWTGLEYSTAATMIANGLLTEGFTVVQAASDRYDGQLRSGLTDRAWGYSGNPFGDDECGKFYARAMSVWSLLLACQGFVYDGPAGLLGFKPPWRSEDHRSFFTAAEGWGVFSQRRDQNTQTESIEVRYGRIRIESLAFETSDKSSPKTVTVTHNGQVVPLRYTFTSGEIAIELKESITLRKGESLIVRIACSH